MTTLERNIGQPGPMANHVVDKAQQERKVFKKSSPKDLLTVYVGKRDFYDDGETVEPIEGVVTVEAEKLRGRRVFCQIQVTFSYGLDTMDMIGMNLFRTLYSKKIELNPNGADIGNLSSLQRKLKRKLGDSALPFRIELPTGVPSSITLQQPGSAKPRRCGVDYELAVYAASSVNSKPKKKRTVRLNIRKLSIRKDVLTQVAPQEAKKKSFFMSSGKLEAAAQLSKELYYHGEPVEITVNINNMSTKTVKGISIKVRQFAMLRAKATEQFQTKCVIASVESTTGFPLKSRQETTLTYRLTPSPKDNKAQLFLALDGQLKDEDTSLASSTRLSHTALDDNLGLVVSYEVKVRLIVSYGADVICKLPFTLAMDPARVQQQQPVSVERKDTSAFNRTPSIAECPEEDEAQPPSELEDFEPDEAFELVFEDFVRGRAEKFYTEDSGGDAGEESDDDLL